MKYISCKHQLELKKRRELKKEYLDEFPYCMFCFCNPTWLGLDLMHLISLAQGGKTDRDNTRLGCRECHIIWDDELGVDVWDNRG